MQLSFLDHQPSASSFLPYCSETEEDKQRLTRAFDGVVSRFLAQISGEEAPEVKPSAGMLKAAACIKRKGFLTMRMMVETLRRGQISAFVAQFSKFTGLPPGIIENMLHQPNGQGLAIACKAFEIKKSDFISLYLLTSRVRRKGKMLDIGDVTQAISYFDRITEEIARGVVDNSAMAVAAGNA